MVCEFVAHDSSHFRIADARRTRFLLALAKQAIYRRPLSIGTLVAVPTQQLNIFRLFIASGSSKKSASLPSVRFAPLVAAG
jgi:hypothetical protein